MKRAFHIGWPLHKRRERFCPSGGIWLLMGITALLAPAGISRAESESLEIRTFEALWRLTRAEAAENRSVRIPGLIVCFDATWGQLHIYDGQHTRNFNPQGLPASLEV